MKKIAIIDEITNGDGFQNLFDDREEAINAATREWTRMSNFDKSRRCFFAVMVGELDEDGCLDFDNSEIVKSFKSF